MSYAAGVIYLLDTSANRNLTMGGWCRDRILDDDMALCIHAERNFEDGGTFLMLNRENRRNVAGHRIVQASPTTGFNMRISGVPLTIITLENTRQLALGFPVTIPELDAKYEEVTGRNSGLKHWMELYGK